MSTSGAQQVFKVTGELNIDVQESQDKAGQGTLRFVGTNAGQKTKYAELRMYGFRGFGYLLMDTSAINDGRMYFRCTKNQGGSSEGGTGENYTFQLDKNKAVANMLEVRMQTTSGNLLGLIRDSTISYFTPISLSTQNTIKGSELMTHETGFSGSVRSFVGFQSTNGSQSDGLNFGVLGFYKNGKYTQAMRWTETNDVEIPNKLTAGTVYATTYENLPPSPPPDLTPIYLDTTNNRVGIRTSTPDEALQIAGDCHVDNQLRCAQIFCGDGTFTSIGSTSTITTNLNVTNQADVYGPLICHDTLDVTGTTTTNTINAQTYLNLPPPDVLPITLDKPNNRVGIAVTTPSNTLDVGGTIGATSFITSSLGMFPGGFTGAVVKSGTGDPEGQKVGTVGSLYLRTDGAAGTTLYTKQTGADNTGWSPIVSMSSSDLLPITLDKTNDRVGINTASPQYELQVSTIASIPRVTNIEYLQFGTSRPDFMFIRMSSASTPTLTADPGSLYLSSSGGGVWYKEAGIGTKTNWVKLAQSNESVGSAIMVRNPSLSIASLTNVYFTLPTTNALVSEWNTGSTETTTQVINTRMGVTIDKPIAQAGKITFTQNGTYTITIRWKFAASSAGDFVVQPEFRLNNVNVPSNGYYNLQASVSTAFATRQQLVFTRYIDTAIVNQMYTYIYMNSSSGNIDFTLGINKVT